MNNKLFVANLAYAVTDNELTELFGRFGQVNSCNVATDRATGRPRGFAFIEMESQAQAEAAIKGLNGHELVGRQLSVNISEPKPRATSGRSRY